MNTYNIMSLHAHPEWRIPAARWFQEKWEIPLEEYLTSIDEQQIIAGAGVIENDFHNRKDLAPNICALYVEPEQRCRGICRTSVGTYLQGYGSKKHQPPLPHHRAYLALRTLWLGILVHGERR